MKKETKKARLTRLITMKGGMPYKSWTIEKLQETLSSLTHVITYHEHTEEAEPWSTSMTPKDFFPVIEVDQKKRHISILTYENGGFQKKCSVDLNFVEINRSEDGTQILLTGEVSVKNWNNYKCSGTQKFCYAIFEGDSGHIYTHRAPATKGWMNADPGTIRKRLRKLGIGVETPAVQQGDFLLKKANGNAHPDTEFKHERMGAGHHNFETPVLFHRGQYKIIEPTLLIHTAVDGIQHPDVMVEPGTYIVGTTANQLHHSNARD